MLKNLDLKNYLKIKNYKIKNFTNYAKVHSPPRSLSLFSP